MGGTAGSPGGSGKAGNLLLRDSGKPRDNMDFVCKEDPGRACQVSAFPLPRAGGLKLSPGVDGLCSQDRVQRFTACGKHHLE